MATKDKKLKLVQEDNEKDIKALPQKLDKMVKSFSKEVKSEAEKYGIILDVKIAMRVIDSTTA